MSKELTDEDIEDLRGMELWNIADGIDSLRAKLAEAEERLEDVVAALRDKHIFLERIEAKLAESAVTEAALRKILIEIEKKETRCPFYCGAIRVLYGDLYKPNSVTNEKKEIKLMKHTKNCPLNILSHPPSEGAAAVRGLMEAADKAYDDLCIFDAQEAEGNGGDFELLANAQNGLFEALAAWKKAGL